MWGDKKRRHCMGKFPFIWKLLSCSRLILTYLYVYSAYGLFSFMFSEAVRSATYLGPNTGIPAKPSEMLNLIDFWLFNSHELCADLKTCRPRVTKRTPPLRVQLMTARMRSNGACDLDRSAQTWIITNYTSRLKTRKQRIHQRRLKLVTNKSPISITYSQLRPTVRNFVDKCSEICYFRRGAEGVCLSNS